MKVTAVQIDPYYRKMLDAIIDKRKEERNPVRTKRAVIEQLIEKAHKREVK